MPILGIPMPWEVTENIANTAIDTGARVSIGLAVLVVGLLFIARKLPAPFGQWGAWIVGGVVSCIGVAIGLGV